MTLWLARAGSQGEFEQKFLDESRVYLTWDLNVDLAKVASRTDLQQVLRDAYPSDSKGKVINHSGQIWSFVSEMSPGDWIVLPSKSKAAIHFAEVVGDYTFEAMADELYKHYRAVKWFATDVPRSNFGQDLLYSFGAFMTICRISRNDAEARVKAMAKAGWKAVPPVVAGVIDETDDEDSVGVDLERLGRDQIAKLIIQKYKGRGLEGLVDALLKAQGYTTHWSPEGPDKGVDILAAPGPLGFGRPRICVQVKSGDGPVDLPTLNQLIGAMQNVHADQGLLVSWGGFKSSVDREVASQFFRVRLWDQDALIAALLADYERLPEEVKVDLSLKRIWVMTVPTEME